MAQIRKEKVSRREEEGGIIRSDVLRTHVTNDMLISNRKVGLASFCRETLGMAVSRPSSRRTEAPEWLWWLRNGVDKEIKKSRGG